LLPYFVSAFEDLTVHKLETTRGEQATGHHPLILIGDVQSNPWIREFAGASYVGRPTAQASCRRPTLLTAGGSQAALPGAAGELLNYGMDASVRRKKSATTGSLTRSSGGAWANLKTEVARRISLLA
jgi:hypothetical protein